MSDECVVICENLMCYAAKLMIKIQLCNCGAETSGT